MTEKYVFPIPKDKSYYKNKYYYTIRTHELIGDTWFYFDEQMPIDSISIIIDNNNPTLHIVLDTDIIDGDKLEDIKHRFGFEKYVIIAGNSWLAVDFYFKKDSYEIKEIE